MVSKNSLKMLNESKYSNTDKQIDMKLKTLQISSKYNYFITEVFVFFFICKKKMKVLLMKPTSYLNCFRLYVCLLVFWFLF